VRDQTKTPFKEGSAAKVGTTSVDFDPIVESLGHKVTNWSEHWKVIPILDGMNYKTLNVLHRLNSLGSLFYFIKVTLRKHRLTTHLHRDICSSLEKDSYKDVLEIPRDHFKSTICSEGLPIWWALPFSDEDEKYMRALGYGDEFIKWMRFIHDQDTRTLLVSANIVNAMKLGRRISFHYENNSMFRGLFPEVIPTSKDSWSEHSMTHHRTGKFTSAHGEGTFDLLGVGAALQSRHYNRQVKDDLVGLDALDSETVMDSIIDYHKLTVGAFDSDETNPDKVGDEIVVGNRWQYEDLNSYLRLNEKEFTFTTHSAIGGCCSKHPHGVPIFPEEFSIKRLNKIRERLGTYFYSCQYLNSPTPPGESFFKESNLRRFHFERTVDFVDGTKKVKIVHETKQGEVIKDVLPSHLKRVLIVDPNHSGRNGRSRHAVIVCGFAVNPPRQYLLDVWAEANDYSVLCAKIYELSEKWKIYEIHAEQIAFQKFLSYHFDVMGPVRKAQGKWTFNKVLPLKVDLSEDAKKKRIEGMQPVYERGEFWVNVVGAEEFMEEYRKYPYSKLKDILDTIGYTLTLWQPGRMTQDEVKAFLAKRRLHFESVTQSQTGY
jgi:hypothetical protein